MVKFTLIVHNMPKLDRSGWCDPYVIVEQNGETVHTTQVRKGASDCVWNDFPINAITPEDELTFTVKDNDPFWSDDLIGQKTITFGELVDDFCDNKNIYNLENGGQLEIQFTRVNMNLHISISDIVDTDGWFNTPDTYFKAISNGNVVHTSEVVVGEESFCNFKPFPCVCESVDDELTIQIYDQDTGEDEFIGTATFTFESILEDGVENNTIYNTNGELMANVTIRTVEKVRRKESADPGFPEDQDFTNLEKEECAERHQQTIFEQEVKIQKGGFYGKVYVLDSFGQPGKWLSNCIFAGKKLSKIFLTENSIYTADIETNELTWVTLLDKDTVLEELNGVYVTLSNSDRRMEIKCGADVDAEELHRQIGEVLGGEEVLALRENEGMDGFALPREESLCRWFVLGFGRGEFFFREKIVQKKKLISLSFITLINNPEKLHT